MAVSVSTHILDTEVGEPVGGVKVALYQGGELISLQETDADGRVANLFERDFRPGEYRLICAPLRLEGAEGAPARVLLLRD